MKGGKPRNDRGGVPLPKDTGLAPAFKAHFADIQIHRADEAEETGGVAGHDRIGWHISRHHAPSAHDRVFTDRHVAEDRRS